MPVLSHAGLVWDAHQGHVLKVGGAYTSNPTAGPESIFRWTGQDWKQLGLILPAGPRIGPRFYRSLENGRMTILGGHGLEYRGVHCFINYCLQFP